MRRHLSRLQRVELITGLVASVLGVLALGFLLFGPTISYATSSVTTCNSTGVCTTTAPGTQGTTSLVQSGISSTALFFLSLLLLCLLGIGISAWLHSTQRQVAWLVLLWVASVLTLAITILGILSIGIFIAPAALLALIAAGIGTGVQVQQHA